MHDFRPIHQFGHMAPTGFGDFIPYQFYRIFPENCLLTPYPMMLGSFTASGVDKALEKFDPAVEFLAGRGVERISLGGVPLSAYAGRTRMQSLLDRATAQTNIPVTCDFEEAIEGLRHLGMKRVAVAAKWDAPLMQHVESYLRAAGIEVAGLWNEAHTAQQVISLRPKEGLEIALSLGRRALSEAKHVDGLLLCGGGWLVLQAVVMLEAEFGKPIVSNALASYWAAMRQVGIKSPLTGLGTLLDSLQ